MSLLGLWTPEQAPPKYGCTACGAKFTSAERSKYISHVALCSRAFESEIGAMAAERAENPFLDGTTDPERRDWIRQRQDDPLKVFDDLKDGLFT